MKNIPRVAVISLLAALALSNSARADDAKLKQGAAVYERWCAACHSEDPLSPGTIALHTKYNGALPAVLMQRTDLTPQLITHFVRNGFSVMPIFRKTEISDEELSSLTAYMTKAKKKKK
jgi:(+)-pinoresinol hydroxylase